MNFFSLSRSCSFTVGLVFASDLSMSPCIHRRTRPWSPDLLKSNGPYYPLVVSLHYSTRDEAQFSSCWWARGLTMQTTGSRSFSPGTSIHVIFMAPGSPGGHGVRRSSTMTPGLCHNDPRTLKRHEWQSAKQNKWLQTDIKTSISHHTYIYFTFLHPKNNAGDAAVIKNCRSAWQWSPRRWFSLNANCVNSQTHK